MLLHDLPQSLIEYITTVDDSAKRTVLFYTIATHTESRGTRGVVEWLLKNGADPNHMDLNGDTPLLAAIMSLSDDNECTEICRILLQGGANPNLHGRWSMSPLLTAVVKNNLSVVQLLVEYGANLNAEYQTNAPLLVEHGETALTFAARAGQREMTLYLVKTRKNRLSNILRALSKVENGIKKEILDIFEYIPPAYISS
jgi:ankyrin repeat protein